MVNACSKKAVIKSHKHQHVVQVTKGFKESVTKRQRKMMREEIAIVHESASTSTNRLIVVFTQKVADLDMM
jgi:hypothetical protein